MEDATDKRSGRNTVHIIEDDESVRRAIARLMHSSGLETTAFSSAEEFLQTESPNAGCLIVDIQLPGMNGFDLEA